MSTIEPLFLFNELPLELQREIFSVAANADMATALRLVLVARRVKEWIQPYIYDMVTLGNTDTELFLRTMESMPPNFVAINVKRLCLSVSVGGGDAARILRACTGVVDLAFWVDYLQGFPEHSLLPLISPLPLRRLSIELAHYRSLFREPPAWCETLTHLDVIFWSRVTSPVVPYLDQLPSLSHLLLRLRHNRAKKDSLLTILSACKALKILVIYDESDRTEDAVLAVDPRVVKIRYPANVVHDWEARAKLDLNGTWSRAEELVQKQRHAAAQRQRSTSAVENV
ncbi:hypothetical protein BYT27DRAFT_7249476 [Phlegmacium glaucopus]|nr:hypothetical protein BYT27DRAFT_7249476 [Phlegmacium glaucopus]